MVYRSGTCRPSSILQSLPSHSSTTVDRSITRNTGITRPKLAWISVFDNKIMKSALNTLAIPTICAPIAHSSLLIKFTVINTTEENRLYYFLAWFRRRKHTWDYEDRYDTSAAAWFRENFSEPLQHTLTHASAIINFIYHILFLPCIPRFGTMSCITATLSWLVIALN